MKEKIKMITYGGFMTISALRGNLVEHDRRYYQYSTENESFIEMSETLKEQGVQNNKFMLEIYDKDLVSIDPFEPGLSMYIKSKIIAECSLNIWYYLREIARIPMPGGDIFKLKLNRTTLASAYCYESSLNSYTTTPRQMYSTITQVVLCSYEYIFGTYSIITVRDRMTAENELYIKRLEDVLKLLPDYIQNAKFISNNQISTLPSGKTTADIITTSNNLTANVIFMNDFEYIRYPMVLFKSIIPEFAAVSINRQARNQRAVININSAVGDMKIPGMDKICQFLKELCIWEDRYYDLSIQDLKVVLLQNSYHDMFYIGYSYKELGLSEDWFKVMSLKLGNDEDSIKKELLLERV